MEIHAPEHPITSWRDVFVHLGVVTIGILIALGLESLVEWQHHRSLATEARVNILSELRDNQRELDGFLKAEPGIVADQKNILHTVETLLAKQKLQAHQLTLSLHNAELRDGSWTTAQATGALNFMSYRDVKTFEGAYELQNMYRRFEEKTIDASVAAMNVFETGEDPSQFQTEDLRSEREKILASLAALTTQTQIGEELNKRYAEVLRF
jgi:hypothetical protein